MALLDSWGKRFFDSSNKDWKSIAVFKCNTNSPNILWSRSDGGSPFWKSLTWALNASGTFYCWEIGNGRNIKFWHDTWAGDCSLKTQFWELYEICNQPDCTVSQVWDGVTLKLSFRRCVDRDVLNKWCQLLVHIKQFPLSDAPDVPIWGLEAKGIYSVKSFYNAIKFGVLPPPSGTAYERFSVLKAFMYSFGCVCIIKF